MILILGGTTEGRIAARTLEESGKPFYYSTKGDEQDVYKRQMEYRTNRFSASVTVYLNYLTDIVSSKVTAFNRCV